MKLQMLHRSLTEFEIVRSMELWAYCSHMNSELSDFWFCGKPRQMDTTSMFISWPRNQRVKGYNHTTWQSHAFNRFHSTVECSCDRFCSCNRLPPFRSRKWPESQIWPLWCQKQHRTFFNGYILVSNGYIFLESFWTKFKEWADYTRKIS